MGGLVRAEVAHAAAMAAIHAECFPPVARWGAEAMELQLALLRAFGFIDAGGGFVLARVAADEAEILTLAVAPAARRRGLARALLRRAANEAAAAGATSLFLEVADDNAAARALYAAEGFTEVGRRRRYYPGGGDALVLRRAIGRGEVTIS